MAVDQKRNGDHPIDHGFWSHCEIAWHRSHAWHRSYVECWWVAVLQDGKGEEVMRSAVFRSPRGRDRGAPNESHQALVCLAALEEALASEGWEPVEEPPDEWYALRFRRPRVPLRAPDG